MARGSVRVTWNEGVLVFICFFKQKTSYEMRIRDWSSDVCSSDLPGGGAGRSAAGHSRCAAGAGTVRPFDRGQSGEHVAGAQYPGDMPERDGAGSGRRQFGAGHGAHPSPPPRSEEHTSELQSLMRISYAVFCLKKKNKKK